MANAWEGYEPQVTPDENEWATYSPGAPVPEPEQPKVGGVDLIKNSYESLVNALKGTGMTIADFERNLAAGALKMPTEVTGAVLEFGENLGSNLVNVGRQIIEQPMMQQDNTLSEWVKGTGRQGAEMIRPSDQGVGGRIVEEVGSYALPSAGITKMMISSGALLQNAPRALGAFENMLVDTAKDPRKTMILDQTLSALMASAGQTSEEAGLSPTQRALVELTTGVLPAGVPAAYAKAKNIVGNARFSKYAVGKYLNDVAGEDPLFWKTYNEMSGLSKKHGVEMDLPELAKNPELRAAQKALTEEVEGGATRIESVVPKQQAQQVRGAFDYSPRAVDQAIKTETDSIAAVELALKNKIDAAERVAVKEAIPYKQASIKDAGDAALITLDTEEALATAALSKQYAEIGLEVPVKTDLIRTAINNARKSALPKNQWRGELEPHLKGVLNVLTGGAKQQPKLYGVTRPAQIQREQPTKDLTLEGIQELQGLLKSAIRTERTAGKDQLVRELSKVLDSTYKQLDSVTGLSQKDVSALKSANNQARLIHQRFDDSRVSIFNKMDKQGVVKTASEDVIKNIIRPDSQANSVRSVEAYQNAIGNPAKAKAILKNGFIAKLAVNSLNKQTASGSDYLLDVKSTANFLKQHKNFLNTSGLKNEFKNPAAASKELELAQAGLQDHISQMAKSELSKWVGSDDPIRYVSKAISDGSIKRLLLKTKSKPLVQRGIREAAWEGVLKGANVTRGMRGLESDLTVDSLKLAFQRNNENLRLGLGEAHYNDARELAHIVDSLSLQPTTTAGFVTERPIEGLTEKLLTGLRAASHGFVRPDLIVAQMGKRSLDAVRLVESKKLLKEALINPDVAKEMIRIYRSGKPGVEAVKATLSPFVTSSGQLATE